MLGLFLLILKLSLSAAAIYIDAYLGSNATLSCNTGSKFEWYKLSTSGSQHQKLIESGQYAGVAQSNLRITNVEYADDGWYRCQYTYIGGSGYSDVHLNVKDQWGQWSTWGACSITCGEGTQTRSRSCLPPIGCTGDFTETRICSTQTCPDIPTVVIRQTLYNVNFGNSVILVCDVTSNLALTSVFWGKNQDGVTNYINVANSNNKYSGSTVYNPSLQINNVVLSDEGYYVCFAVNDVGPGQSSPTFLDVKAVWGEWENWNPCNIGCGEGYKTRYRKCYLEAVVASSFCDGDNEKSTYCLISPCRGFRGDSIALNCIYSPYVSWQKENGGVLNNNTKYTGFNDQEITINHLQYSDAGKYRCKKWWNMNYVFGQNIEIEIEGTPSVTVNQATYPVVVGGRVVLGCNVVANPEAYQVWWTNVHGNITGDSHNRYSGGTKSTPSLTIINITENYQGKYKCHANNSYGESSAETTVETGKVTGVNIPLDQYVTIVGHQFTLQCLINNSPDNKNVYWYKDSYTITILQRYSGGSLNNPSLTVQNVQLSDAGIYKCKLETRFGFSEDTTQLTVLSVSVVSQTITKTANDSVTLVCTATGGLTLKWQRNGDYITTTDSDLYGGGTIDTPSLTIKKLTRHHAGNYTCETSYNSVTAVSKVLHLVVEDIPLVETPSDVIQASSGSNVQLDCIYESNPSPISVFWKKDGVQVIINSTMSKYNGSQLSHPALVIMNADPSDAGIYQCVIENNKGKGFSSEIQLVFSNPDASAASIEAVAGGIGAAVLLLIVVVIICVVVITKRRRSNANKQPPSIRDAKETVEYRTGGNRTDGLLYINIGRASNLQSSTDTDDDIPTKSLMIEEKTEDDNNTYYNVSDTITCIKVEDLKDYIKRKQINNSLEEEYKSVPYGAQHSTKTAQLKENIPKNRFKTTFPYDHSRVILQTVSGSSRSDYINANYVDGFEKEKCYIASQGPLKSTFSDFWRMIWENNIKKIVMLTGLVEGAKVKCDKYWPDGGKRMVVGNFVLTLIFEKERAAYVTREISIEEKDKTKEKRFVLQYHFTAWPDHGTPDPLYLVLFHKHVTSDHACVESGPLLVHCSAGIGRTGTYIGLDALEEEGRTTGYIDVVKYVKKMRYARMNMVQTPEQYVCLHQALLEAFTMTDTNITKDKFSDVWKEIQSDKRPINHQRLHEEYKMLESKKSEHAKASYTVAASSTNTTKNRSNNIVPSDDARLYLVSFEKGRSDYINAVQVPSYTQFSGYITTQLPLEDTKTDFWTMIRDHNSSTIVLLLNEEQEAGMVYEVTDDNYTRGPFKFKVTKREKGELDIHETSIIMSKKDDRAKEVCIYQAVCSSTPDAKVLCKLMNLIATRISMSHDPVTVVSSDGAKNCGLFCLFANAVSSMTIDDKVNIFQLARLLQLRRPEFFDDFNEYKVCYEALVFYLESSNVYANF